MSLARAFTTIRPKQRDTSPASQPPQRTVTVMGKNQESIRNKISGPVELLSTTNMLSYNAPDLFPSPKSASSANSTNSTGDDSDAGKSAKSNISTPPSSPDTDASVEPNHLSCYFGGAEAGSSAPKIPTRAPSHTKKSHDSIGSLGHRKSNPSLSHRSSSSGLRSSITMLNALVSQSLTTSMQERRTGLPSNPAAKKGPSTAQWEARSPSSPAPTTTKPQATSTPLQTFRVPSLKAQASAPALSSRILSTSSNSQSSQRYHPSPPPTTQPPQHRHQPSYQSHPFGKELAQVTELAEEFSGGKFDAEERELLEKGLCKFGADEYMSEIQGLFVKAFGEVRKGAVPLWI